MYVADLLDALGLSPNVEVIVPSLPERSAFNLAQLLCNILLKHLERNRKLRSIRFCHQQMDVLWHDYISSDVESVPFSGPFQGLLEDVTCPWCSQAGRPSIAAER